MNSKLQMILILMFTAFNCMIAEGRNTTSEEDKAVRIRDLLKEVIGDSNAPAEPNEEVKDIPKTSTAQGEKLSAKAGEGDPEALYELGRIYLEGLGDIVRDVPKALELLRKSAESGNSSAMLELAYIYDRGHGVERNESKALEWLRKAAESDKGILSVRKSACNG